VGERTAHMIDNKRRFTRHRVEAPVLVRSIGSGATGASRGHCLNLSIGGAGAIVSGPWMPGQVVSMELALPAMDHPVLVDARLCHRNRLYCGFEFLAPSDDARKQIMMAIGEA